MHTPYSRAEVTALYLINQKNMLLSLLTDLPTLLETRKTIKAQINVNKQCVVDNFLSHSKNPRGLRTHTL